jgi:hypothetical protein
MRGSNELDGVGVNDEADVHLPFIIVLQRSVCPGRSLSDAYSHIMRCGGVVVASSP